MSLLSCATSGAVKVQTEEVHETEKLDYEYYNSKIIIALSSLKLPQDISKKILDNLAKDSFFTNELLNILKLEYYLWILLDKQHPIDESYVPSDLVKLENSSFLVNRNDLFLRKEAFDSLSQMASLVKAQGFTLVVSSAYRSYKYQEDLYNRYVSQMGRSEADRVSARAGHSQHQLGFVVDFGSITNSFASTNESRWLSVNASRFGWSLSYPNGYEHITGYRWESWHYRYVGKEVAAFIDTYFNGIQQYALQFIHEFNTLITN